MAPRSPRWTNCLDRRTQADQPGGGALAGGAVASRLDANSAPAQIRGHPMTRHGLLVSGSVRFRPAVRTLPDTPGGPTCSTGWSRTNDSVPTRPVARGPARALPFDISSLPPPAADPPPSRSGIGVGAPRTRRCTGRSEHTWSRSWSWSTPIRPAEGCRPTFGRKWSGSSSAGFSPTASSGSAAPPARTTCWSRSPARDVDSVRRVGAEEWQTPPPAGSTVCCPTCRGVNGCSRFRCRFGWPWRGILAC